MVAVIPIASTYSSLRRWRLVGIIEQLLDLEGDMTKAGLHDSAGSLRTVIDDLRWQYEEMKAGRTEPRGERHGFVIQSALASTPSPSSHDWSVSPISPEQTGC